MSLITNAQREGDGATRLWSLSACADDANERTLLQRHAVDESSHALAYLALVDACFSDVVDPKFRAELKQLSPGYSMSMVPTPVQGSPYAHPPALDDYVQMNIAEIRTTVHHLMQRIALAPYCMGESSRKVTRILDTLLRDELSHVAYTAKLIDSKARTIPHEYTVELYAKRLAQFNAITERELGTKVFA